MLGDAVKPEVGASATSSAALSANLGPVGVAKAAPNPSNAKPATREQPPRKPASATASSVTLREALDASKAPASPEQQVRAAVAAATVEPPAITAAASINASTATVDDTSSKAARAEPRGEPSQASDTRSTPVEPEPAPPASPAVASPLATAAEGASPAGATPPTPTDRRSADRPSGTGAAPPFDLGASTYQLLAINDAVLTFMRHESEAALAHMRELSGARTPGEAVRLQIAEFQRAADSTLGCLGRVMRTAASVPGPPAGR